MYRVACNTSIYIYTGLFQQNINLVTLQQFKQINVVQTSLPFKKNEIMKKSYPIIQKLVPKHYI